MTVSHDKFADLHTHTYMYMYLRTQEGVAIYREQDTRLTYGGIFLELQTVLVLCLERLLPTFNLTLIHVLHVYVLAIITNWIADFISIIIHKHKTNSGIAKNQSHMHYHANITK